MESVAMLNEDNTMDYKDKDGNSLYKRGEDENYDLKGTLLPKSNRTDEGGSTGFDISQPMPIIVDPNHSSRKVIMTGSVVANTKEGESISYVDKYDDEEELLTIDDFSEEIESSPIQTAPTPKPKEPKIKDTDAIKPPESRIVFDLGEHVGEFECFYHRIFKDGVSLVLVWDNRYHGSRYNPSSKLKDAIEVYVGKERDSYTVLVGPKFTDDFRNEEYMVLFIVGDEDGKDR